MENFNLHLLNKSSELEFPKHLHAEDLEIGKKYPVIGFKKINTQYGANIVAEIAEGAIFLPKRVSCLFPDTFLEQYAANKLFLIYCGKKRTRNGLHDANTFKFLENVSMFKFLKY